MKGEESLALGWAVVEETCCHRFLGVSEQILVDSR